MLREPPYFKSVPFDTKYALTPNMPRHQRGHGHQLVDPDVQSIEANGSASISMSASAVNWCTVILNHPTIHYPHPQSTIHTLNPQSKIHFTMASPLSLCQRLLLSPHFTVQCQCTAIEIQTQKNTNTNTKEYKYKNKRIQI